MSVRIVEGDILDAEENIIAHQVNCFGGFGSGLAGQIAEKWPECKNECQNMTKSYFGHVYDLLGKVCWWNMDKDQWIANVYGQYRFGRSKVLYTNYDALKNGLENVEQFASTYGFSVAIPHGIGCGLGGGDWNGVVLPMILDIFEKSDVEVKIYKR